MRKHGTPKTLLELFTEDEAEMFQEQFCECHKLQICPTAWMNGKDNINQIEKNKKGLAT